VPLIIAKPLAVSGQAIALARPKGSIRGRVAIKQGAARKSALNREEGKQLSHRPPFAMVLLMDQDNVTTNATHRPTDIAGVSYNIVHAVEMRQQRP
jgi:hypothetical protein